MVATFCLRLAAGLILMLPILPASQIPPRFFRVHFLTALGLLALAGVFIGGIATIAFWLLFAVGMAACLLGSIVWHLNNAPGGKLAVYASPIVLTGCLVSGGMLIRGDADSPMRIVDDVLAALMLGSTTTAMLMGHSYLISPAMSIRPLMTLLGAIGAVSLLRIGLAGFGLWTLAYTTGMFSMGTETMFLLSVRWALGLIAPLVLGWLAYETARIRSTQSATGILYVVVIVTFLGELTSQLLLEENGNLLCV